jgi:hypothetical protein
VVIEADIVLREVQLAQSDVLVGEHRHVMVSRLGAVHALLRLDWLAERYSRSASYQLGGTADPIRREVVKGTALVAIAPSAPCADLVEDGAELSGRYPGFRGAQRG